MDHLRVFSTRFFGRATDLDRLCALFADDNWLVTIKGPAGMGKTRLARRYADTWKRQTDAARVYFCDLTEVRDRPNLLRVVAQALDLAPAAHPSAGDDVAHVGDALAARGRVLLIVDNCEQIVEDVADVVTRWRAAAPRARFLATSRQVLRLSGECVHELGPLGLPADDGPAAESDAVQLFLDRAALARPGYAPTPAEEAAVGALVRALDGLPLAIELAAARMGLLGAADVLAGLPRRFDVLAAGPRDAGARQRTLRGALEWSWDLLAPHERAALAQTSVFRGGFTIESAGAVVDLSRYPEPPPIIDVMQSLYDKSLIRRDDNRPHETDPRAGQDATALPARFTMLESIRELAAEKLAASGMLQAALERHAEHILRNADAWGDAYLRLRDHHKIALLARELGNLLAVHERALAGSDVASRRNAVRAALALDHVFLSTGPLSARRAILQAALDHAPPLPSDELMTRWRAELVYRTVHYQWQPLPARAAATELLAAARSLDDAWLEGWALEKLGFASGLLGALAEAEQHYRLACDAFRRAGNRRWEGIALGYLGSWLLNEPGRRDQARSTLSEALAILRSADDVFDAVDARDSLATLEIELGLHDQALARLHETLAIPHRDTYRRSRTLALLGWLHHERGDVGAAQKRYQEAGRLLEEYGHPGLASVVWSALGGLLAGADRTDEAASALARAAERAGAAERAHYTDPTPNAVLEAQRGQLDLALARARAASGDDSEAHRLRREAERRLAAARAVSMPWDDLRFAIRQLENRLALDGRAPAASDGDALIIGPRATWFELPGGRRIDLGRQRLVHGVLLVLARRRLERPGAAVSVEDVLRAVWPGERVAVARAASQRVYGMVNRLREAGLRDILRSEGDGYLLDPAVKLSLRE